jgi:hypothetical protein
VLTRTSTRHVSLSFYSVQQPEHMGTQPTKIIERKVDAKTRNP